MSGLLSFVGWAVLPHYATSILQSVYYGITIRAGDPRPQPGTPRFDKHRRRIFIFVVTAYLLYTLYESFHQVRATGDFYSALGVSPLADERTIKSRFRRLAAQHHPDKMKQLPAGSGSDGVFVYLKLAQDTLLDPARRFGYDRFGPQVNEWRDQHTVQEILYAGLKQGIVQYLAGLGTIVVLNFVYWSQWGRFWRFYTFAALVVLELVLMTQPLTVFMPFNYLPQSFQSVVANYLPNAATFYLLPFQSISLARRASLSIHIFISQITPASSSMSRSAKNGAASPLNPQTAQSLGQLAQLARMAELESARLLDLTLSPFRGEQQSVATLRKGMKEGLVLGSVRNTPEVKEAVARALRRGQGESSSSSSSS